MDMFYPTNKGLEYAALTAMGKSLVFTKGKFGNGVRTNESIESMTELIKPLGELPIVKKIIKGNTILISTEFTNEVKGILLDTFYLSEVGLFAKLQNEDGTDDIDNPEVLVGYAFDSPGDKISGGVLTEFVINFPMTVAASENIVVEISSIAYALQKDLEETYLKLNEHTEDTNNPHNVTKSQVGLGNVPNVATNNQTPTFTEATTRSNINSGETMSTILGKIKKFFTDLKTVAFTGSYNDLSNKPTSMVNPNSLTLTMNGSTTTYNGSSTSSKTWYAPTSAGTNGYELISSGGAPVWKAPSYAVCSNEGTTSAKTVSITNFKLVVGAKVFIKFHNAHSSTATATLNISSTGAKPILNINNQPITQYNSWSNGETVEFLYDGTSFVAVSSTKGFCNKSPIITVGTINGNNTSGYSYCDFLCNGINDHLTIKSAIEFAHSISKVISVPTGIGSDAEIAPGTAYYRCVKVLFKRGVYNVNGSIFEDSSSSSDTYREIVLEGEGGVDTIFKKSNNTEALIDAPDFARIVLRNITLIHSDTFDYEFKAQGLHIDNCRVSISFSSSRTRSYAIILGTKYKKGMGVLKISDSTMEIICESSDIVPCYTGFEASSAQLYRSDIILKNKRHTTQESDGNYTELNLIYNLIKENTGRKSMINDCNIYCYGNTSISGINTDLDMIGNTIRLGTGAKISHYSADLTRVARNIFSNNKVYCSPTNLYLRFSVITGNTFDHNQDTELSSLYNHTLYNALNCTITGNMFIGYWKLFMKKNAIVSGNIYKGSLTKDSAVTSTVTLANNQGMS